jgi:hypothetical protein
MTNKRERSDGLLCRPLRGVSCSATALVTLDRSACVCHAVELAARLLCASEHDMQIIEDTFLRRLRVTLNKRGRYNGCSMRRVVRES